MKKTKKTNRLNFLSSKIDFDKPLYNWPENPEFPINIESQTVYSEISKDIINSSQYLIVTGFTSLSQIIDFFTQNVNYEITKSVRIILGTEPDLRTRKSWGRVELADEIKNYWLEQDYSIFHGGKVIKIIELIKNRTIKFRILEGLHAKIYVGDNHAILGSSNFSKNGLYSQIEANIRVQRNIENEFERQQYENMNLIAENYFQRGIDYTEDLLMLLRQLLKIVTWQEALSRAIVELIENNWFKNMPELQSRLESMKLWPIQKSGLVQALHILQKQGCVLIADPTGAGKTKMVNTLKLVLFHWLWENGRKNHSYTVTICPPLVVNNWKSDLIDTRFQENTQASIGKLSNTLSVDHEKIVEEIKNANVLVLDEAHNFLNEKSNRSRKISEHISDFVVLMTATPINKRAKDLLRIIELLGIDNLKDTEIQEFIKLKNPRLLSKKKDYESLKNFISKLMVRRTKNEINEEIQKEQEKYLNKFGEPCRFPEQIHNLYKTGESSNDINIASKITELAEQLKGLIYLKKIDKPDFDFDYSEQDYIKHRIEAAKYLSIYNIQSNLRSSKVALIEHVYGTNFVKDYFKLKTSKSISGNFIEKLKNQRDELPQSEFDKDLLENWLTDINLYQQQCDKEISIYNQIGDYAKQISDSRDNEKVKTIIDLFKKHELVIAFDSTVITLDYFSKLIKEKSHEITPYVITGKTKKDTIIEKFKLHSKEKNVIALCSDTMSEGVNIQQISTVIFLDMPSVLRIAEQRIGRIDRLDSPHKYIQILWPDDSDEFALKTDKKLVKASIDAEILIGSNTNFPDELIGKHLNELYRPTDMIKDLNENIKYDTEWKGFHDAFKPVHDLYKGYNPLITENDYKYFKGVEASVKTKLKISIAETIKPWLFIALKGDKYSVPRWYFINDKNEVFNDLSEICNLLRQNLPLVKDNEWKLTEEQWDDTTTKSLNEYLIVLQAKEIDNLPNKRERALRVAKYILEKKFKKAEKDKDKDRIRIINKLLRLFEPSTIYDDYSIDYFSFSQMWLDILNPYLYEKRQIAKRKVICLNDLKKDFETIELTNEKLNDMYENVPRTNQTWNKIAACIMGVKSK